MDVYARRKAFKNMAEGRETPGDVVALYESEGVQSVDLSDSNFRPVNIGGVDYLVNWQDTHYQDRTEHLVGDLTDGFISRVDKAYAILKKDESIGKAAVRETRDKSVLSKIALAFHEDQVNSEADQR